MSRQNGRFAESFRAANQQFSDAKQEKSRFLCPLFGLASAGLFVSESTTDRSHKLRPFRLT